MKFTKKRTSAMVLSAIFSISFATTQIMPAFAQEKINISEFCYAGQEIENIEYTNTDNEESIASQLPDQIDAISGNGETVKVDVDWNCIGDLEEDYYCEFIPEPNDSNYIVTDELTERENLPYILAVASETRSANANSSSTSKNIQTIFNFLTTKCNFNTAAACGILANIECESNFNPYEWGDHNTSYGICQWHNNRLTAMQTWCKSKGYNWESLTGQLYYLRYELSANNPAYLYNGKTISNYLKNHIENTADGAFNTAKYWCANYEVPANIKQESLNRGNRAKSKYWPMFKGAVTNTMYTTVNLHLRSQPTQSSSVLITIPKRTAISVSNLNNGWYKTTYKNKTGYVSAAYVSKKAPNSNTDNDTSPTETTTPQSKFTVYTTANLNVRSSTSTGSLIIGVLKSGTKVKVLDQINDWYKISYNNKNGYISTKYTVKSVAEVFTDISSSAWYCKPIQYVYNLGLMTGTSKTTFSPNTKCTRGMAATILHHTSNKKSKLHLSSGKSVKFSDVASGMYYTNSVSWIARNGIAFGYGNGRFGVNDSVTREQFVAMLYNYANKLGLNTKKSSNLNKYSDASKISSYAKKPVQWAVGSGLMSGSGSRLNPKQTMTRAEAATFLKNFIEKYT